MATIKELFNRYKTNSLQDNVSTTDKLLGIVIDLLEKLVNKNKIVPYNSGATNLPIAVTTQPSDVDDIVPSNGGYYQIKVEEILGRKPDILYLINNGSGTIFCVVLYSTTTSTKSEYQIFEGDRGTFYNVYELRIRTNAVNTEYIVTENEMVRPKDISFLRGNPYISEQTLAVGATRTENIVTSAVLPLGLGRNAHDGYIINNGPGNITIQYSSDGIIFSLPSTIIPNQIVNFNKAVDLHTIVITNVALGASYVMNVH